MRLLCLPFLIALSSLASAQPPDTLWTRVHRLTDLNSLILHGMIMMPDGGALVSGGFADNEANLSGFYLLRVDNAGNIVWRHSCGDSTRDVYEGAICQTAENRYVLVGYKWIDRDDPCAIMVDSSGNVIWQRDYVMTGEQVIVKACSSADGGFLLAYNEPNLNAPEASAKWMKVDSNGNPQWTDELYVPGYVTGISAVHATSDSGYILSGGMGVVGQGGPALLIKLGTQGRVEFWRTYHFSDLDDGRDVVQLQDGSFVMCGSTEEWSGNPYRSFTLHVSASGDSLWSWTSAYAEGGSQAHRAISTPDGGYAILCDFSSKQILRFNAANDLLWRGTFSLPAEYWHGEGVGMERNRQGSYLIVNLCALTDTSVDYPLMSVVKTEPDPVSVSEHENPFLPHDLQIHVFPNPFNSATTITLNIPLSARHVTLTTFNLLGQVVREDHLPAAIGQVVYHYDASALASGIYLLRAEAGAISQTTKLVVMK